MKFTLNRDRVHASVLGLSVEFKKGVPTHVPPELYAEVQAVGAVPEDEMSGIKVGQSALVRVPALENMSCSGRVAEKRDADRSVRIEVQSTNQHGQTKITGDAWVALP